MDKFDRKILQLLILDSKISYNELAEQVDLSPSACFRRVQSLQEGGIIERFTIQINPNAMGAPIKTFAEVKVNRQEMEEVQNFKAMVASETAVLSCHQLSGSTDFLLQIATESIEKYTDFIESKLLPLKAVSDVSSSIVLAEVKPYTVSI